MDRYSEIKEFVQRSKEFLITQSIELDKLQKSKIKIYNRNYRDQPQFKIWRKHYEKYGKGKHFRKIRNAIYDLRFRNSSKKLSQKEIEEIKKFYLNTPLDHHVDHIIPLSKGGKHCLSNLQYLPALENLQKHAKVTVKDKIKFIRNKYIFNKHIIHFG